MSNQVSKKQSIGNFLNFPATKNFLEENLQERRSEFVSNLISLTENDKELAECDPKTLMMCAMNATALNLPLNKNLGFAYIIAYKGVPSFQIGYKGLIQMAIRTGQYQYLNATEVREGEMERNKITGQINFLKEKPNNRIVGYVAYLKLMTGFSASLYMSEEEVEAHALKFSKSYQYDQKTKGRKSVWSDPHSRIKMALKTVLKGLLGTYGVMTSDLQRSLEADSKPESTGNDYEDAHVIPEQKDPTAAKEPQKVTMP